MPLIRMRCAQGVDTGLVINVRDVLVRLVAEHLHCEDPGGGLTPSDIEAHVDTQTDLDLTVYDLDITIFANFYPGRNENLDDRTRQIRTGLELEVAELPTVKYCLWVFLGHAAFVES